MTQHINPGTDTTINPVVIDDTYGERKPQQPNRRKNCQQPKRYYPVTPNELDRLAYNEKQSERFGICRVIKRETMVGLRSFNPLGGIEITSASQQCIGQAIKKLKDMVNMLEGLEPERGSENWYAIQAYKRAIALLQAGGGK